MGTQRQGQERVGIFAAEAQCLPPTPWVLLVASRHWDGVACSAADQIVCDAKCLRTMALLQIHSLPGGGHSCGLVTPTHILVNHDQWKVHGYTPRALGSSMLSPGTELPPFALWWATWMAAYSELPDSGFPCSLDFPFLAVFDLPPGVRGPQI